MDLDYKEGIAKQAATVQRGAGDLPLTADIMKRTAGTLEVSMKTQHRLYELRDRLFGGPASGAAGNGRADSIANGFKDAYSAQAQDLHASVMTVDELVADIASRL